LDMSVCVSRAVGLGYLGVDVVLDRIRGPLLLEANARPGLAIQIANHAGLGARLAAVGRR
jgi:D-alanine-D-alanine ligase-like ATP-grasp enzyme